MWLVSAAQAQPRSRKIDRLDQEQKTIENRLKKTEELLEQTRQIKRQSFNELRLLDNQIKLRESLVGSLSGQISRIDREIERIDGMIAAMERDIERFQESYARSAYVAYKSQGSLSMLVWIFSARSFNQAYDRLLYFKEFARYRRNQIQLIQRTRQYLERKKEEKERIRRTKTVLMGRRVREKEKLNQERTNKDQLVRQLKSSEEKYLAEMNRYRREIRRIKEQIRQLIVAEQRELSEAERSELSRLSGIFTKNKGKLPWPVPMNAGEVTGYFGKTTTETGNEIINDGIFISTKAGQAVRCIFGGEVTMITSVPTYGKVVIVQHGNFRSVYANLENVKVEKGDRVELLQEIGSVKTNKLTGETQLYFQLYREFNPVNPLAWILYRSDLRPGAQAD